jgi:large conductance mechanosensitive channel
VLKEFKEFALKGNLVELAVAFILGLAFATLVQSVVANLVTPVIAAIVGKPDFSRLTFTINRSVFTYGKFLNDLISFLLVALVLFFVVRAYNRMKRPETPAPVRECPFCRTAIADGATRCPACTSDLGAAPAA